MFMQRYFSKVNKYIVLFNLMYILVYCKVNDLLKVKLNESLIHITSYIFLQSCDHNALQF